MKKKLLLVLLPALALGITGCKSADKGGSGEQPSEQSSGQPSNTGSTGGTTGGQTSEHYGTVDEPLSVAGALEIANEICSEVGSMSDKRFYIEGNVKTAPTATSHGWKEFTIVDNLTDESGLLVWSINKESVTKLFKNDHVVVEGLIKNHEGTLELTNTSGQQDYPTMVSREAGLSTVTLGAHENATVEGLPTEKVANDSEVTFTVTADTDYRVDKVKVNNETITATEGQYKFTVAGDMEVVVTTVDEDAPATETIEMDFTNSKYKTDGVFPYFNNGNTTVQEITLEGSKWNCLNSFATSYSGAYYLMMKNADNSVNAFMSNHDAFTKSIVSVEVTFRSTGVSTAPSLNLALATTELTSGTATGAVHTTTQQSAGGKATIEAAASAGYHYLVIGNLGATGSSGKNIQLAKVVITLQ